ncbi:MAG: adenosylcobinamide-GDP ribazoletransferase [Acidimicrobiales bacterium]
MIAALAFLTPLGGARAPTPGAVRWFPVVGLLVGVCVGGVWRGAAVLWAPALAAALAVVADLALTGMLHVDGLADSGDGLLPHLPRERRLAVMAEPAVGAFGATVVLATLLLRWSAFASMAADVWLVAGLWVLSRTLMAVVVVRVPYARETGLATAFRGGGGTVPALGGLVVATGLVLVASGPAGFAVLVAALVAGGGVVVLGVRRLGGFTGDVLGAAGVVAETAGLVVAAARW